jgi:hypothetical protein
MSAAKPTTRTAKPMAQDRQRRATASPTREARKALGASASIPTGTAQNTDAAVAVFEA